MPNDVEPASTCRFASTEFSGWFETGTVTAGGAVKPADSLNLLNPPTDPVASNDFDCTFYKWAARMFLWLTSPRGGGRVLQSEDFYDISAPISDPSPAKNGKRILTRNDPGKTDIDFSLRTSKTFEHTGLPGPARGVLMAQNSSLVYTASFVNDVYAYYMTGAKNHRPRFNDSKFPILQMELNAISDLAAEHGITFRNPHVLALQVKTTWVDTAGFGGIGLDPTKYIRIRGKIPTYDMSNPTKWIPKIGANGSVETRETELALVGAHIVGSASGNSNMIWATFEHVDNTPVATYAYKATSGRKDFPQSACRQDVAQNTCGAWLFSRRTLPGGPLGSFNRLHMNAKNAPNIEAAPGRNIEPSDTRREHAWGSSDNDPVHNSRVIGINTGSMGMLAGGDVRKNYLLIGASWGGGAGSDQLANTTLETYEQSKNCSECHVGNKPDDLSHMYRVLLPLFSP